MALDVPLPRPGQRVPDDPGIGHVVRARAVQYRTDQDRHPHRARRLVDLAPRFRIGQRVDVGGVLRPDDERRPGQPPGAHRLGNGERALDVVVQHGRALGVEVKAEARDVALHDGDRGGRGGAVRSGRGPRHRHRRPEQDQAEPGRDGAAGPAAAGHQRGDRRGDQAAGQRDGEGDQRHPAVRGQPGHRRVVLGEGQPPPREPVERAAGPGRLLGDPQRRRPQRPAGQPGHRGGGRAEPGDERRLGTGQDQPGRRADVGPAPPQQRHEERQPERQAQSGAGPPGPAPGQPRERRHRPEGQRPDAVRRECEHQRPARGGRPGQREHPPSAHAPTGRPRTARRGSPAGVLTATSVGIVPGRIRPHCGRRPAVGPAAGWVGVCSRLGPDRRRRPAVGPAAGWVGVCSRLGPDRRRRPAVGPAAGRVGVCRAPAPAGPPDRCGGSGALGPRRRRAGDRVGVRCGAAGPLAGARPRGAPRRRPTYVGLTTATGSRRRAALQRRSVHRSPSSTRPRRWPEPGGPMISRAAGWRIRPGEGAALRGKRAPRPQASVRDRTAVRNGVDRGNLRTDRCPAGCGHPRRCLLAPNLPPHTVTDFPGDGRHCLGRRDTPPAFAAAPGSGPARCLRATRRGDEHRRGGMRHVDCPDV